MSISPLAKKLLVKPGHKLGFINAPEGYRTLLDPLPEGVRIVPSTEDAANLDFVQAFVRDSSDLERLGPLAFRAVKHDGLLWICYPKGSSKVKTDLSRDTLVKLVGNTGYTGVALVSVDNTWSAMRFRPAR